MHVLLDADTQVIVEEYQLCWLVVKLNRLFGLANQTFLFVDQKARLCSANEEVLWWRRDADDLFLHLNWVTGVVLPVFENINLVLLIGSLFLRGYNGELILENFAQCKDCLLIVQITFHVVGAFLCRGLNKLSRLCCSISLWTEPKLGSPSWIVCRLVEHLAHDIKMLAARLQEPE